MSDTVLCATRRDGERIVVGGLVSTDYHPASVGCVFKVEAITPYSDCESGFMVLVHLKDEPDRKLRGFTGLGLDTNWFRNHVTTNPTGQD